MKRFMLIVLMLLVASPLFAKEYRVRADFLMLNEKDAIAVYNYLETQKAKVYQPTGEEAYSIPTSVCFIDSWDTETPPKGGSTRMCVDWGASVKVEKDVDTNVEFLTTSISRTQAEIDKEQAEIDAKQAALDVKKDELTSLSVKEEISK